VIKLNRCGVLKKILPRRLVLPVLDGSEALIAHVRELGVNEAEGGIKFTIKETFK